MSLNNINSSTSNVAEVVVIGSGLAGLSSACTLAARGHRVTVLEKNEWIGGKAAELKAEGFRFDMGPTILTLPSVLKKVFEEAGVPWEDYLDLLPLDPQWRCFFDATDKQPAAVLDLVSNVAEMQKNITRFSGDDGSAQGYAKFIEMSKGLHGVSDRFFFWRSVGGLSDTMQIGGAFSAAVLKDVLSLKMGQSVAQVVRKHVSDERVAQMMDHFTQYVGSAPDRSPAVLCGIAHMQTDEGIWYPVGGTRAVPMALHQLAIQLGVQFRTEVDVKKIDVQQGAVQGVTTTTGEHVPCDAVVSNCDAVRTYRELIGGTSSRPFQSESKFEPACSGVVLYLGLNRRYEQLLHHNFIFSQDAEVEFESIYDKGEPADDLSAYVCAPAISEPSVAPEGGEALYVLVHTPYLRPGQDWKEMLPAYREKILDKLEQTAEMKGIRDSIVYESALTPQDIHDRYRVLNGAIYGLASHGKYTGAFKPGNRRKDIRGLYLAGGAAHPGPGMPMVLMSGWIAADSLDQDVHKGALA